MNYTKGERSIYCADDYWLVEVKGSSPVCIIGKFITKEDALLDATAPDMYEKLEELMKYCYGRSTVMSDDWGQLALGITKVLAKVEGGN